MVVYYDETVVKSVQRYLTIKYFIIDREMEPLKAILMGMLLKGYTAIYV